ncbi:zinc-ribbon domain containing protein [Planctopirus ephydatiae]|uniref:zinc-ribbon domain containing protein n=1 Tax=Planctopirus ephydatiae TaxID=2528019 RepID=UPI0036F3EF69
MCSGSFFWRCVDCGRDFVFFAREQQHWFETLKPAGIAWAALLRQTDEQHPAREHPWSVPERVVCSDSTCWHKSCAA